MYLGVGDRFPTIHKHTKPAICLHHSLMNRTLIFFSHHSLFTNILSTAYNESRSLVMVPSAYLCVQEQSEVFSVW